jgi:hypothetical protein
VLQKLVSHPRKQIDENSVSVRYKANLVLKGCLMVGIASCLGEGTGCKEVFMTFLRLWREVLVLPGLKL